MLRVDVILEACVIMTSVDHELFASIFIDEWTDEGPEYGEHTWGSHDEEPAHRLGVVRLHHLDEPQQCADAGSPQMTHTHAVQVHDAGAGTERQKVNGWVK